MLAGREMRLFFGLQAQLPGMRVQHSKKRAVFRDGGPTFRETRRFFGKHGLFSENTMFAVPCFRHKPYAFRTISIGWSGVLPVSSVTLMPARRQSEATQLAPQRSTDLHSFPAHLRERS